MTLRAQSRQFSWNDVVAAPDGRLFAVFPRIANNGGPSLALVDPNGDLTPYPDAAWNTPPATPDATGFAHAFIGLNAIHLAPDGTMWAVDTGSPGFGRPALAGGTRLLRIDLATDQVDRVLTVPASALRPKSMIDEIRFNGDHAYVTDSGTPGLLVVDLRDGGIRRVLDHDPALTAQRPIVVDGEMLKGPDGKPEMIHADQLEVSPDGRSLYVQPLPGPMSRIETSLLDDPQISPKTLSSAIQFWYDTPALGGTAIATDGTLYLDDVEDDSILALSPDRSLRLVLHDPRLHWPDAPFLGPDGMLTVPVSQLDRAAPFRHGHSQIRFPVAMYALQPASSAPAPGASAPR